MRPSSAVRATVASFRRPGDLLPFYLLSAAIPTIVRVIVFLGAAIGYLHLETTGRLGAFREELAGFDRSPPDPEVEPEAFAEWVAALEPVLEPLASPLLVGIVVVTAVVALVAALVLSAGVTAGRLATCHALLGDERGLMAGIGAVRRHWRSFLGLYVLEVFLWLVISALALGGVAAVAALVSAGDALVASLVVTLVGLVAFLLWLIAVAVVRAIFAFAPVAVVVDGAGVAGAIRGSAGFVRTHPVEAASYYVLAIGALVAFGVVVTTLSVVGITTAGALLGVLFLTPALDLLKTALYGGHRGTVAAHSSVGSVDDAAAGSARGPVSAGLRRGARELVAFVRATPGLHALALGFALVGFGMGWLAADPLVGSVETSITARLSGFVPLVTALELFGNNWFVAVTTAYGGVVLAVPAAASLWFNGFVLAIVARLEIDPEVLAAFVAPHGVLEIPALLVAGALGLHLGVVGWRGWRGRLGRDALADELERAFWVLVGVGLLLAVAAAIEGFVSPYYFRLFL